MRPESSAKQADYPNNLIWIMPAEGKEVGTCSPYAVGIRVFCFYD
jgi:hypothetical protein